MDNLTRLTFARHSEFTAFAEANGAFLGEIWRYGANLGNQEAPVCLPGVCDICACQTAYRAATRPAKGHFTHEVNWWSHMVCGCGMNSLDRAVFRAFLDEGGTETDRLYHVGHYARFVGWLRGRAPNLTTSQFDAARAPGEVVAGVRYEDLTRLTFEGGAFDWVIATEILEHVPNYRQALREMARVLRPGGRVLMTFPWLGGAHYDHITRAELRPDGTIRHILPPEYHGDPAAPDGVLSFRSVTPWSRGNRLGGLSVRETNAP